MTPRFGYKRDLLVGKDVAGNAIDWVAKDKDYKTALRPALPVDVGDIDLSAHATYSHQLNMSACAGNATGDSIEVLNSVAGYPKIQISRLFIYTMARWAVDENGDGQGDIDRDEGSYIRLCFDTLSRFGVCDENIWPYEPSKVHTVPSIKAMRQAVGHRIHSYYRIKQEGEDRLEEVVSALRAKHPVVFGTNIAQSFITLRGEGPVSPPTGATAGGHAMMIIGYMNGLFLVKNSWGSGWGANGFCFMRPEYISWSQSWDFWVPTLGTVFRKS